MTEMSDMVKIDLPNGDVYKGEIRDGRPHGRGVYAWADGSTYGGEWFDGLKQGRGLYMYANGDMFEGGYHQGVKHGYGAASWSNGSRYVGQWHDGREHGQGRYTTGNGQCYTGTFNQGFVDGEGVHTWDDGSAFHCTHSMGVAVSQGIYIPAEESEKLDRLNPTMGSPVQEVSFPFAKEDQGPGLLPVPLGNTKPPAPTYNGPPLVQLSNGMIGYFVQQSESPRKHWSRSHNGEGGSRHSSSRSGDDEKGRRKGRSRSRSPFKAADPPKISRAAPLMQHSLQQTLPAQQPQSPDMGMHGQRWLYPGQRWLHPLPKTQQPLAAGETHFPSGPQSNTSVHYYRRATQ